MLGADALEEKYSLGHSVSIAVHAALSNCYKAFETLGMSHAVTGAEIVYFRAATDKLEVAVQALRRQREILATGRLSEAALAWLKALDYDRLYVAGTERGRIPAVVEQWNRLVKLMRSPDHLTVTNCLIADVESLRREIHSIIDILLSGTPGAPLNAEPAELLSTLQTALVQFLVFAQMVNYVDHGIGEPLDTTWCLHVEGAGVMRVDDAKRSFIQ
jgi:hypothetical protein